MSLQKQLEEKNLELKRVKEEIKEIKSKIKGERNLKTPFAVRIYTDEKSKPYIEVKFKSLSSAEKFLIDKCNKQYYEDKIPCYGYTLIHYSSSNSINGEIIKVKYAIEMSEVVDRNHWQLGNFICNIFQLEENQLNCINEVSIENNLLELTKFNKAIEPFKSEIKSMFSNISWIEYEKRFNLQDNYSILHSFYMEAKDNKIKMNSCDCIYNDKVDSILFTITL